MKKVAALFLLLFLGACGSNSTHVISSQSFVIPNVPSTMFNCPVIEQWPNSDELTDLDVARLLVELQRNNLTCRNSIDALREFLSRATQVTSSPQ